MGFLFKLVFILVILQISLASAIDTDSDSSSIIDNNDINSDNYDISSVNDFDIGSSDEEEEYDNAIAVRGDVTVDPAVCGPVNFDDTLVAYVHPFLWTGETFINRESPCLSTWELKCVPSETQACPLDGIVTVTPVDSTGIYTNPITFTLSGNAYSRIAVDPSASQIIIKAREINY